MRILHSKAGLLFTGLVIFPVVTGAAGKPSDWISAPKPKFPAEALKSGSEGAVKLQVVVDKDGHVASSRVVRSSGNRVLDAAAQTGVAKWRMNPSAVKASDRTRGRPVIVQFEQEAIVGARYPDRTAYFSKLKDADRWIFAPFPSYPLEERRDHHTGTVLVKAATGADGQVISVELLKSSGYYELDRCALAAVRLWRVHNQYAGKTYNVPIRFEMQGPPRRIPAWM